MDSTITNPKYVRMLMPESCVGRIEHLDYLIEFYFKVMVALGKVKFKSLFRAQMTSSLQMIYTKAKSMRQLVEGFRQQGGVPLVYCQADHTVLYTIVRAAYEQLCAFELIYVIPDTEEKRLVMKDAYIAAGEVNRLKLFTEESLERNKERADSVRDVIEDCRREIHSTHFYKALSDKEKTEFEKQVFKKGEYRIILNEKGKRIVNVGWDEVRNYCRLNTDALHGVYKYACNMAHPSYLGLVQFHEAYKEGVIDDLNATAVMQMISIMSVFIMDFMEVYPEIQNVYTDLDHESQFAIRMYNECFRGDSVNYS